MIEFIVMDALKIIIGFDELSPELEKASKVPVTVKLYPSIKSKGHCIVYFNVTRITCAVLASVNVTPPKLGTIKRFIHTVEANNKIPSLNRRYLVLKLGLTIALI